MAKFFLDMEMALDEVADVFQKHNWQYATRGTYGIPNADDLVGQVIALALTLESGELNYIHQGRLAVLRDPEVNGTYQVMLCLGYLYDESVEPFDD